MIFRILVRRMFHLEKPDEFKLLIEELREVVSEVQQLPDFIKDLENQRIIGNKYNDSMIDKETNYFEPIAHLLVFFVPELDPSGESQNQTKEERIKEMDIICSKLNQYFLRNVLFRLQTTLDSKEFLQYMTVCENFCLQSEKLIGKKS